MPMLKLVVAAQFALLTNIQQTIRYSKDYYYAGCTSFHGIKERAKSL